MLFEIHTFTLKLFQKQGYCKPELWDSDYLCWEDSSLAQGRNTLGRFGDTSTIQALKADSAFMVVFLMLSHIKIQHNIFFGIY
jgi:hypothetical protein